MLYMVLTIKERLGLDIWPKTLQQAKSSKRIMKTIRNIKDVCWQKASGSSDFLLSHTGKEKMYIHALLIFDCYQ